MPCEKINNTILCCFADYRNYICFEHTTYLFEFSERFGPAWFSLPDEKEVDVEPCGHMSCLWDIFEDWYKNWEGDGGTYSKM